MSRGPGAIERAIETTFKQNPSGTFTVEELARIAYPGLDRVEKKHRVAVSRAANRAAARCQWRCWRSDRPGRHFVYLNPFDLRSYVVGRLHCDEVEGTRAVEEIERRLDDPSHRRSRWAWAQPGGVWWLHAEINKARRDGRRGDEAALQLSLDALVRR